MKIKKIGVVADKQKKAREALAILMKRYKLIHLEDKNDERKQDVDIIIALGGDGCMLHTLHDYMEDKIPVYGMNCGTVGFLMNEYRDSDLMQRLEEARATVIHPLKMIATKANGKKQEALAINEVSLIRKAAQAAKIRISVDDVVHMRSMICDGVLVSTPAGSSAYNFSIGGPIIPLKADLLALTPISPFRPRRWRGALLPHSVKVHFEVLYPEKRPVSAVADFIEVNNVTHVDVEEDRSRKISLLFDPGHSLEERIVREQFAY